MGQRGAVADIFRVNLEGCSPTHELRLGCLLKKNLKILDLLRMLAKKYQKLQFDGDLPWYKSAKKSPNKQKQEMCSIESHPCDKRRILTSLGSGDFFGKFVSLRGPNLAIEGGAPEDKAGACEAEFQKMTGWDDVFQQKHLWALVINMLVSIENHVYLRY